MVKDKRIFGLNIDTVMVGFCAALWLVVILSFSRQTAEVSTANSDVFVEKGLKIANTVGYMTTKKTPGISASYMTLIVRKSAHIFNFTILGFLYTFLGYTVERNRVLFISKVSCLCGIMSAIADEFFQYFVPGRSAQIKDVCLDFFGIVCGIGLFVLCVLILEKHKRSDGD